MRSQRVLFTCGCVQECRTTGDSFCIATGTRCWAKLVTKGLNKDAAFMDGGKGEKNKSNPIDLKAVDNYALMIYLRVKGQNTTADLFI